MYILRRSKYTMSKKKCSFDDNITIYETYSSEEYDRHCIDSILYQKMYNRVTNTEWDLIFNELNMFKQHEMALHLNNIVTYSRVCEPGLGRAVALRNFEFDEVKLN